MDTQGDSMNERLSEKIKVINILLAVSIVFLHAKNYVYYSGDDFFYHLSVNIQEFFIKYVFACAVPFLFFISGYLFYYNLKDKSLKDKIQSRVRTLLVPYLMWNVIATAYFVSMLYIPFLRGKFSIQNISGFSDIIKSVFFFKYNQINWFVFQLIIYVIMSPGLYYIIKNKITSFIFILILMAACLCKVEFGVFSITSYEPVLRVDCLLYYMLGAMSGYYLSNIISRKVYEKSHKSVIVSIILIIVSFMLISLPGQRYNFIAYCLQIVSIYQIIKMIDNNRIVNNLMEHIDAFFLLQTHYLVMYPMKKIVASLFGTSWAILPGYILCPVITIWFVYLIGGYMKKKQFRLYKILIGGR